ncbi:hypothetical protein J3Q64DRAFT_1210452 [Phycomyces blakesleeanus]|uniref:Ubiquitin-like protease family profile domain-containing protein n=1 Tax=Phycomyces blakesleeanus TaxID=4837 RepID=A0ABR3B9N4_PHYBL
MLSMSNIESNITEIPKADANIKKRKWINLLNNKYSHVVSSDEDELSLTRPAPNKKSIAVKYKENSTNNKEQYENILLPQKLERRLKRSSSPSYREGFVRKKRIPTKINVPSNENSERGRHKGIFVPRSPTLSCESDSQSSCVMVSKSLSPKPHIIEISEDEDETYGKDGILFTYPFHGKDQRNKILITRRDTEKLKLGVYINDTLVDFFLLWSKDVAAVKAPEARKDTHIFNCFFYPYLREMVEKENNEFSLKKWTSNLDLFKKKHLIVPVNESGHWFLMIACNIDQCLSEKPTDRKPRIYLLDSIGVERKSILKNMVKYLNHEAKARYGSETTFIKPDLVHANVPQQKNGSDCGIYLIHFVGVFLENPEKCIDLLEATTTDEEAWGATSMDEKREYLRNVVRQLNEEWAKLQPDLLKNTVDYKNDKT